MGIYIVDSNESHAARLTSMLQTGGYTDIQHVTRIETLYALIGAETSSTPNIDLLLMESAMPDGNGIDACRIIKETPHTADIPVIIVTTSLLVETLQQAFDAGATDYLIKPISRYELLGRVRSAVRLKQAIDQRQAQHKELLELLEYLEAANQMLVVQQKKSDRLLRAMYEIGEHLHSSSDLQESLHSLIAAIKGVVAYDVAEMCIYDSDQQQLITAITANALYTNYVLEDRLFSTINDPYHQQLINRETVLIRDLNQSSLGGQPLIHSDESVSIQAYLGLPLLVKDQVVGTLELGSKTLDSFSDSHMRFLQSIALQAATVIVQAQDKLRREAYLHQQMNELNIDINNESRVRQVEEITGSEFFQEVMQKAQRIRTRRQIS